jgi:hypothetical protein
METRRRDFVAESLEDLDHAISELAKRSAISRASGARRRRS